ncbi:DUF397 domain-containing protein [Streptomyces sp. L7]
MSAPSTHQWFKSSYSGGSGTECVECAHIDGAILLRDSKHDGGELLRVGSAAWRVFIGTVGPREVTEFR